MHINFSAVSEDKRDVMPQVLAGVLAHVEAMTAFLNPTEESYRRFGSWKAPGYLSWSAENRSQLIRVPAAEGEYPAGGAAVSGPAVQPVSGLCPADPGGDGGRCSQHAVASRGGSEPLHGTGGDPGRYRRLPETWAEAKAAAAASDFIKEHLPAAIIQYYT